MNEWLQWIGSLATEKLLLLVVLALGLLVSLVLLLRYVGRNGALRLDVLGLHVLLIKRGSASVKLLGRQGSVRTLVADESDTLGTDNRMLFTEVEKPALSKRKEQG